MLHVELQGIASSNEVVELQKALKTFADAKAYPAADPGPADGIVGDKTIKAIASIINQIPKLPSWVKAALVVVLGAYELAATESNREAVAVAVRSYANEITLAVKAISLVDTIVDVTTGSNTANDTNTGTNTSYPSYPAGTIYTIDKGVYRVAVPITTVAAPYVFRHVKSGVITPVTKPSNILTQTVRASRNLAGTRGLGTCCGPLGEDTTTKTHEEVTPTAPTTVDPATQNATYVDPDAFLQAIGAILYKKPWFWAAVGGGVLLVGGVVYLIFK